MAKETILSEEEMTLNDKLMHIQTELHAPKDLYNSFGKYKYRNAEGIQEALKHLLEKYGVNVVLADEMTEVGGRVYVKATAAITDCKTNEHVAVCAYAREADTKKGMDDAQVTGATSSYARKYALNGLFLLDDTKDVDTEEYQSSKQAAEKKQSKKVSNIDVPSNLAPLNEDYVPEEPVESNRVILRNFVHRHGLDGNQIVMICGLNQNSTEQDFADALAYAKTLIPNE
jgi:hypothetical protein